LEGIRQRGAPALPFFQHSSVRSTYLDGGAEACDDGLHFMLTHSTSLGDTASSEEIHITIVSIYASALSSSTALISHSPPMSHLLPGAHALTYLVNFITLASRRTSSSELKLG
jgi:hypothetical protein